MVFIDIQLISFFGMLCLPSTLSHFSNSPSSILTNLLTSPQNCHFHIVADSFQNYMELPVNNPPLNSITIRKMPIHSSNLWVKVGRVGGPIAKSWEVNTAVLNNSLRINIHKTRGMSCICVVIYFQNAKQVSKNQFFELTEAMKESMHR